MVGKAAAARKAPNIEAKLTVLNAETKVSTVGSSPKSVQFKPLSQYGVATHIEVHASTTAKKPQVSRTMLAQQKLNSANSAASYTRNKNILQLKNTPSNMLSSMGPQSIKSGGSSPANRNLEYTLLSKKLVK
jgi:hypothetical protein